MKILVALTRFPWPVDKGDKLRAFRQIEGLSQQHEVHLVCLHDSMPSAADLAPVQKICKSIKVIPLGKLQAGFNLFRGLFNTLPFQVNFFRSGAAKTAMQEVIAREKPDAIFVQLIRMHENLPAGHGIPMLLDYQDCFSAGMKKRIGFSGFFTRPFVRKEARRLEKYEAAIAAAYRKCIIISGPDLENLPGPAANKTVVVPNGVSEDFFRSEPQEKKYDLLFTGNMGYHPNILAAVYLVEKILPALQARGLNLSVCIAGARPAPQVKALASDKVTVVGPVPDLRPYFNQSRFFVAPLFTGSGLQNKLLESMAMGLPTFTSPLSNAALGAVHREHLQVCADENEFAGAIAYLMEHPDKSEMMARNGCQFIRDHYTWQAANQKLESLLQEIIKK